jgi:hypothetical protein
MYSETSRKDGNLSLDDLLVAAVGYVSGDIADKPLLRVIVKDLLPQRTWGVEVLRSNIRKEGHGVADEMSVCLVQVNSPVAERDGLNRGKIVWSRTL